LARGPSSSMRARHGKHRNNPFHVKFFNYIRLISACDMFAPTWTKKHVRIFPTPLQEKPAAKQLYLAVPETQKL
jgi:hypothetical protein